MDYAHPEFFPYWAGTPWFFGLGPSIFVVNRFNHSTTVSGTAAAVLAAGSGMVLPLAGAAGDIRGDPE